MENSRTNSVSSLNNLSSSETYNANASLTYGPNSQNNLHNSGNTLTRVNITNKQPFLSGSTCNPANEIKNILSSRKVRNATQQKSFAQTYKRNKIIIATFLTAIVGCIIASAIISPLFAIGIVASILLIAIIAVQNSIASSMNYDCGLANMAADALLAGIKNNTPPDHMQLEDQTNLLCALDRAVTSFDSKKLIARMTKYNKSKNNKKNPSTLADEKLLQEQLKKFTDHVFNDDNVLHHLRIKRFNPENVKNSIDNYMNNTSIDQLSKTILGGEYTALKQL
jgi:phosphoribosyl-dephospho-CoA transferase